MAIKTFHVTGDTDMVDATVFFAVIGACTVLRWMYKIIKFFFRNERDKNGYSGAYGVPYDRFEQ